MVRVHSRTQYNKISVLMRTFIRALAREYVGAWIARRYNLTPRRATLYYENIKEMLQCSAEMFPDDISWIVEKSLEQANLEYQHRERLGKL